MDEMEFTEAESNMNGKLLETEILKIIHTSELLKRLFDDSLMTLVTL